MGSATILVVDDERKIRDLVRSYLELEGYSVLVADTGERALESASRSQPDLASNVPIIMLTAKAAEDDRIAGLRLGADDYLAKPFSPRELVARVEAVLRRANGSREHSLSFDGGRLSIDRDAREVTLDGSALELTRSEFDLLHALASHAGRVFSRFELINRVQGYDYEGYERTIDQHVKNLRRKLREDPKHPRYVLTAIGVGYKLGMKADA